eukprot:CAMPEP_0202822018 /NCGR_PEP_ID=MMETSP1389-20130828/10782_1 /ASSEMBLY_ACC=CAM_ASM_000865 /TAXON_ID=302021 /ORGANISM="Rhodomonas sp., Strain CCMP768" /LENGTH=44 /DNA_ID= /DNA_START= /DNA_END= /DNA_ORIENTATION=
MADISSGICSRRSALAPAWNPVPFRDECGTAEKPSSSSSSSSSS